MITYFITILMVFFSCFLAQRFCVKSQSHKGVVSKKTQSTNIALFIALATLTCVAGLRYWVGGDYSNYYYLYHSYKSIGVVDLSPLNEPMLPLIGKLTSYIFQKPFAMFFVASVITVGMVLISIYKETDDFAFVTLLYIFVGCWHSSFNGVRQCLAVSIVFLGRHYITERRFFKYLLVCFLAFLAHRSALFCVLFYFVYSEEFSKKRLLIITLITLFLSRSHEAIFSFIGWMNDEEFVLDLYSSTSVNILRTFVGCCPAIVGVYYAYTRKLDKQQIFYVYMMVINAAIRIATADSAYLYRLGMFPAIFVPLGLSFLSKATTPKHQNVFRYLVVIFYFLFWLYEVSKSPFLNNFRFIFGK